MMRLRCASCGERAGWRIILDGFSTPVCLRHLNVWETPFPDTAAAEPRTPVVGEMLMTLEGGFFGPGCVGMAIGSDERGTTLISRIDGVQNTIRVRNEHLVRVEQRWVPVDE